MQTQNFVVFLCARLVFWGIFHAAPVIKKPFISMATAGFPHLVGEVNAVAAIRLTHLWRSFRIPCHGTGSVILAL
jgi:hypothetical protein